GEIPERFVQMLDADLGHGQGLLALWAQTRTGGMGRQSRQPTKPRLAVLARRATKSGAPCHPFPSGCCRKRPSLRCKGSPGARPAFAFASCAERFRLCNAFVSIALTGPGCVSLAGRTFATPALRQAVSALQARSVRSPHTGATG